MIKFPGLLCIIMTDAKGGCYMYKTGKKIVSMTLASLVAASGFAVVSADTVNYDGYDLSSPFSVELGCRYFINSEQGYYVYSYMPTGTAHFDVTITSATGESDPEVIVYNELLGEAEQSQSNTDPDTVNVNLPKGQMCYFIVYDPDSDDLSDIYFTIDRSDIVIDEVDITITEPIIGATIYDSCDPVLDGGSEEKCWLQQELWVDTSSNVIANPDMIYWSADDYYNTRITLFPYSGYCFDSDTQIRINGVEAGMVSFNTVDGSVMYSRGFTTRERACDVIFNSCGNDGNTSYIAYLEEMARLYVYDHEYGYNGPITSDECYPGHQFVCWHCEDDGQDYVIGDLFQTTADIHTLNAVWRKYPVIHYDMMGHGDQIPDDHTNFTAVPSQPAAPTEDGYTFGGWFLDPELTTPASAIYSNILFEDRTVYAKWTDSNEPSGSEDQPTSSVVSETVVISSDTPTPVPEPQTATYETYDEEVSYNVSDFIERLYNFVLDREADPVGLSEWIAAVTTGGQTGGDVAKGFLLSPEFIGKNKTDEEFITILYKVFFDREPDPAGLEGWTNALANGESRESVIDGFINSTEWANLCLLYGIRSGGSAAPSITVIPNEQTIGFVRRLYNICLDRDPDEVGLMAWATVLANQQETGTHCAWGFFFSNEFISKEYSDTEYITRLYKAILGREPDQAGLEAWTNVLSNGASREEIFYGFADSNEFGAICAQYGILR